ncbi:MULTISPECIES: AGE family epimerase/isomerase [Sporosarcina]|uniref:AGE family epimerase/isomerase n=1 Tax=Sporosarcina TaxID=1569 RepID=UPI0018916534|nr:MULTISPECIES: AGE family epimerase/isomerase [Sporosarcina]GKV66576.1 N-acylglucosamine 2-epimerase [Sporosarcina sp. NCCP-2331]GLB56853.1 N-acylglucosamine 2-epimerase [Sporosarcina sp. NCCP-2378]
MNREKLLAFYTSQLNDNFIPYWESKIDEQFGGVFSCIQNDEDTILSHNKYTWSQGRFLWMNSRLLQLRERYTLAVNKKWERSAHKTYEFLQSNGKLENQHVVNATEADGTKIDTELDVSIFADCFYILGYNAYANYVKDQTIFHEALDTYRLVKRRIEENNFKSEPYPIPDKFESHSIPMILINVAEELYDTAIIFDDHSSLELKEDIKIYFIKIMKDHFNGSRIVEMLPKRDEDKDTLLARHVNPGHTLECVWFLSESLHHFTSEEQRKYEIMLLQLIKDTLATGWDKEYGGLFRFVDEKGGKPAGRLIHDRFEELINDTWETKLWWPHSEALYTILKFALTYEDQDLLLWYEKLESYVFSTFPSSEGKEWTQIRDRFGQPIRKVVALPVKDPFHIVRNFLLIQHLLKGDEKWR